MNKVKKHNLYVLMATNKNGCCKSEVYLHENQAHSCHVHSIDNHFKGVFVDLFVIYMFSMFILNLIIH